MPDTPRTPPAHTLAGILTRMRRGERDDPDFEHQLGLAFSKNDTRLRNHCRRELRGFGDERIDEVVQDVKLEAWRWLVAERYRPDEHFRAFLFAVAVNVCRNVRRKRRDVLSEDGLFDPGSEERSALQRLGDDERDAVVEQALRALDPADQDVVHLRYMLDYPYEDVAEQAGLSSVNDVRVALQRSRRRLEREIRRLLDERGLGESFLRRSD